MSFSESKTDDVLLSPKIQQSPHYFQFEVQSPNKTTHILITAYDSTLHIATIWHIEPLLTISSLVFHPHCLPISGDPYPKFYTLIQFDYSVP